MGYIHLLHLRARWYSPGEGVFLSRDVWEGDIRHPQSLNSWAYVEGNPINKIDSSGKTPFPRWRVGIDYMYSCKCGWIDWGHASSQRGFIENIRRYIDIGRGFYNSNQKYIYAFGLHQVPATFRIYPDKMSGKGDFYATSLGIFISQQNVFERFVQGDSWNPAVIQSSFSAEDLVSNLIGFHRGVDEIEDNLTLEQSQLKYMDICGVVASGLYQNQGTRRQFEEIQRAIYDEIGQWPGFADKNKVWGRRPKIRWDGSIPIWSTLKGSSGPGYLNPNCETYACPLSSQNNSFLPSGLLRIQPKKPGTTWDWNQIFADVNLPTSGSYVEWLNNQPLNWLYFGN